MFIDLASPSVAYICGVKTQFYIHSMNLLLYRNVTILIDVLISVNKGYKWANWNIRKFAPIITLRRQMKRTFSPDYSISKWSEVCMQNKWWKLPNTIILTKIIVVLISMFLWITCNKIALLVTESTCGRI